MFIHLVVIFHVSRKMRYGSLFDVLLQQMDDGATDSEIDRHTYTYTYTRRDRYRVNDAVRGMLPKFDTASNIV